MPRWQRIYATVCAAVVGYALGYVLCHFAGWRKLTYYPYEREWHLVDRAGNVPMAYVGTVLWGLGGAAVGGALGYALARLWNRELTRRWLSLFGAWALTAFAYAGLYYTWNLWPF